MPITDSDFQGCTADACSRRIEGKKKRSNYIIEETCRHAQSGQCPFKGGRHNA